MFQCSNDNVFMGPLSYGRNALPREEKENQACPFLVEPLQRDDAHLTAGKPLLPASFRSRSERLIASSQDTVSCLDRELDLTRLEVIFDWLWVVGRPVPPRPLHHQLLLSRELFVTERMDLHLVWTSGRMFIKPVPRFLLVPSFWDEHLSCLSGCACVNSSGSKATAKPVEDKECARRKLWKSALGFLFSYAALVSHESDFAIAQDRHLMPSGITWPDWTVLVEQILSIDRRYDNIHPRFFYGELRLSRLNKIYILSRPPYLRGYMSQWQRYRDFFRDNLAYLAASAIYVVVILTAMQLGLTTDTLASSGDFQTASYVFAVFSITAPLGLVGIIFLCFVCGLVYYVIVSLAFKKRRFRDLGVAREA